jgi:tetratricopeptide (TPR) repeat protein
MKHHSLFLSVKALVLSGSVLVFSSSLEAQEPAEPSGGQTNVVQESDLSKEILRSFLHLQEQLHDTQLAVERGRIEADAALARNNEAVNSRLRIIEDSIGKATATNTAAIVESNRQIQESNSRMLLLAAVFAVSVLLALALTGWLQWRTVAHLSAHASFTGLPAQLPAGYAAVAPASHPNQIANSRLMDALGRLEHRIAEIETSSHTTRTLSAAPLPDQSDHAASPKSTATPQLDRELVELLREGEELLAHEEAGKAIEHFDAVLRKHPGNPEVLLHKGTALERLRRDEEAIECYDLAIRADNNLTMAYLHKGGLYNRMERFSEAMECYEQALRVQESRRSA